MTKISNQYSLTNILTADLANSRLGINNVSPAYSLDLTGTARVSTSAYFATASGSVGIGTTTIGTDYKLAIYGTNSMMTFQNVNTGQTNGDGFAVGSFGNVDAYLYNYENANMIFGTNATERMRILANGNVGIGTSSPSNKLEVNGNGYFSGGLTATGNLTANSLVVNTAIHTYNVTTYYYGQNFTFTLPNGLNSSVDNSNMRMYMIWVWGVNGATEAGCRVWLLAINGPGTAHTATQILGRDANGATSLSLARTSATEATISSNNNAFIKFVSVMALMSN
jgi:hypothetical protein